MLAQTTHYGGGLGYNTAARLVLHPELYRVYRFGTTNTEASLVDARELRVGALLILIKLGTGGDTTTVYANDGTTVVDTVAGGGVLELRLLDNTTGNGAWASAGYTQNAARSFGSTTRPGTIPDTVAGNARGTIGTATCGVWALRQCSGPSIGSTLYTRQDFSAYKDKFLKFGSAVDPDVNTYREVTAAVDIGGPIDTRDLLANITAGPLDFCASDLDVVFYGNQAGSTGRDIHFASSTGASLPVGLDLTGSATGTKGLIAYREDTVAAIAGAGDELVLYQPLSGTSVTKTLSGGRKFSGGGVSLRPFQVAMDDEQNVYVLTSNVDTHPDVELHSYTPEGTLRWSTSVQSGGSTRGAQGLSNVAGGVIGVLVNAGLSVRAIKGYNASTGALVFDNTILPSSGTNVEIRTDGSTWYADTNSASVHWSDFPGGGEPAANTVAYTSTGDWVWGKNYPSKSSFVYGRDGYLYVATQRVNTWPGADGEYASLLRLNKATGVVVDWFDDATNFSSGGGTLDVSNEGRVVIAGDSDPKVALLDANLDTLWVNDDSDYFGGTVAAPQVALKDGSL